MDLFQENRLKIAARLAASIGAYCLCALPAFGQAPPAHEYRDKPGGLEELARNILKAQSGAGGPEAAMLVGGLLLPNSLAWYSSVFDEGTADALAKRYEAERERYPGELMEFFSRAQQDHFTGVQAHRFEKSCDDLAGEETFGVLFARAVPVPLYELRLWNGNTFRRLWALAYVDGAFRYVGQIRPPQGFAESSIRPPASLTSKDEAPKRIRVSTGVLEARLVHSVKPEYPTVARNEHLQGAVHIHAIIGKDGTVRAMQVMKGYCSLSESAVAAVRQWRYSPILLGATPVEVETYIDVVFQLGR